MSSLMDLEVQVKAFYGRFLEYVTSKEWRDDHEEQEFK
jgi:hypothetical protein